MKQYYERQRIQKNEFMKLDGKYIKIAIFVLIIFLSCLGLWKAMVGFDDQLSIEIVYGPEGTTQSSGTIVYGNDTHLFSHKEKVEGFRIAYKVNFRNHRYDRLQMSLGDCGGTIYFDEVHIQYHNQVLRLSAEEIEDYFIITGAETKEKGEKYLEVFTYNALDAKLNANDKLVTWLQEAEYGANQSMNMIDQWLSYAEIWILIVLIIGTRYIHIDRKRLPKRSILHMILFLLVFAMYFIRLLYCQSMISQSGDATSIWQTITSFYSGNIKSSYVLYKGMFSVYPYVWLYQLAIMFGTNEFFFVKIFHALLFAYITVVGVPYLFEKIFAKEIAIWKKWLFAMLMFHLQVVNYAYYNITVDIPSLFCFVVMMDMAVCIWKSEKKRYLYESVVGGIAAGASLCFSGQYKIGAVIGIVFMMIALIQKRRGKQTLTCIVLLITGILCIRMMDGQFTSQIVEPMRKDGEWLPSGEEWIINHLMTQEPNLAYAYISDGNFADTQATQIFSQEKPDFTGCTNLGQSMVVYFKIMLKHPVKFLTSCGNKLFLAFCMDDGSEWCFGLILGFILFYIGIVVMLQRYLTGTCFDWKELIIVLAFLFTVLPSCALHMELRYAMAIQYFMFGFGIFGINFAGTDKGSENKLFNKYRIAIVLGGVVFSMFCVMHYMALLD